MIGDYHLGLFIIASALMQPNIICSGLLTMLLSIGLTSVLKIEKNSMIKTTFLCNSLLLGLFIGYLYTFDWMSISLMIITIGLNLVLCYFLEAFFNLLSLPILSLPFSIIALFLALSIKKFTAIGHANYYFHEFHPEFFQYLPHSLILAFKSFGTFFCIPDPAFGFLVLIGVLLYSPLIALFLLSGFYLGLGFEKYFAFNEIEFIHQQYYFNYSLIFASLAGVFLIPSLYSLVWAVCATLIAVLFSSALSSLLAFAEVPVMALPFNIVVLFILRTVKSIKPEKINHYSSANPEESLERTRLFTLRHRQGEIGLFLPFSGEWTIQQEMDGEWTHKGQWKEALDFVIENNNKTFKNLGLELEDYFCFGQPIYAPVDGYVTFVVNHLKDNKIEEVDNKNNWGNTIIIRSISGFYVQLSHLKKESTLVKVGDYVYAGQEIAKCGNSGYSREPHLHLQTQWQPFLGAYTTKFHLLNYIEDGKGNFHELPTKSKKIKPFIFNHSLYRLLNFKIGETYRWRMQENQIITEIQFEHKLDSRTGKTYWTDGESKLFYHVLGSKFYFYDMQGSDISPIWDFYISAPTIPLITGENITFTDYLFLKSYKSKIYRILLLSWQFISGKIDNSSGEYTFDYMKLEINGKIENGNEIVSTHLKIDPERGPIYFQVGQKIYERI
jgi:urea transporter